MYLLLCGCGVVFPTVVGMNRERLQVSPNCLSVPRGRGDEPGTAASYIAKYVCSPQAWG